MQVGNGPKVAYVLKVYPRFSQTFVVNEILAHQDAGEPVAIYSLRRSDDPRFHEAITRVRSPIVHVPAPKRKGEALWVALRDARRQRLDVEALLDGGENIDAADLEQALFLASSVREHGIDHLHAHFGTVATTVARLAAQLAGIGYSFTAHAKDIFHQQVDPAELRRKLEDAAAVVTVSQFNVRYLKSKFGAAAERVQLIFNGVDLDKFQFSAPEARAPLILGVGRLVEKKGFEYLIDACAELVKRGKSFRCDIAGHGALEADLRARIERLNLHDRVTLCGPLPQSDIRSKLRQASVLAAPCIVSHDNDRDGLPTILLEAMALGTPCVSTDVTGIPEMLKHNQTGLMVAQRDVGALAAACRRLFDDADLRTRLAVEARHLIERQFDTTRNSDQLRRLFWSLCEAPPAAARHTFRSPRASQCAP